MSETRNESNSLPQKLRQARIAAGYSTRAAAQSLPLELRVSHATIANFESGRSIPSAEILDALAALYKRPTGWFDQWGAPLSGVRYRNLKSKVRVADLQCYEANARQWLEAYAKIEGYLDRRLSREVSLQIDSNSRDETIAADLRAALRIEPEAPVFSVVDSLHRLGVRTIELPTAAHIDGFAARFGNEYAVVLNPNTSNDRARMDAAHEMLHVVMGDCDSREGTGESEKRIFRIASHFLLPESRLREAFKGRSLVRMLAYKQEFGISLAAMIYRAQESKVIDERAAKFLWREFAVRGWRKVEPGFVRPDRAIRFEDMLDSAVQEKRITWKKAESITGMTEASLKERISLAMGISRQDDEDEGGEEPHPGIFRVFSD